MKRVIVPLGKILKTIYI